MTLLDGKLVSQLIRKGLKQHITQLHREGVRPPSLAVILVGADPASHLYVQNKRKACTEIGIRSIPHFLPITTTETELLSLIAQLNESIDIDGILVQLPLPPAIRPSIIIEALDPNKDVDGFHPLNMGRLAQGHPQMRPCTPMGVMRLLEYYQINVSGLSALVIGSSMIVGRPMGLELLLAKATVTLAHRKTKHLETYVRQADLIISATGVPNLVHVDWLNKKQILIDVGIHRDKSNKIRGDIDFEAAESKVAWITPVPGGIGPMTVAMLLENTVTSWTKHYLSSSSQSKFSSNSPS